MTSTGQTIPTITLNDEHTIPVVGLGVAELGDDETERAVSAAIAAGYRLIDTAAAYGNEAAVGRAVAASGVPRSELFIATKVATRDQGYTSTRDAFSASLERLGTGYVDLYMIHWPTADTGKYVDTYGAVLTLQQEGLVRSTGVCNFIQEHLDMLIGFTFRPPAVNQVELHPLLSQTELRAFNAEHRIVTGAHTPLGTGKLLDHPAVTPIAQAHGRSPAQVLIRWSIQLGNVVIPRSTVPECLAADIDVFDFELTDDEMATLSGLDNGTRFRPDPVT